MAGGRVEADPAVDSDFDLAKKKLSWLDPLLRASEDAGIFSRGGSRLVVRYVKLA